uniref:C2H2-type domain-containing protein n=1 Tax=Strongyloides venezuelensis TaxID=75913 RepID=A0A0K0FHW7_STRVS
MSSSSWKERKILRKDWEHFRTVNSIKDKIRDYNFDRGFPYNNHLISDPFYDLNERITSYSLDVEAKKLGFSKTIQSIISEKTFDSCINIDEINKKNKISMSGMETVYVLRGYFEFFKNYLSFVNCEDDSMIKGKQILIFIKTVLGLVYLSQDPTIPVNELKKEWVIHADLYLKCVYCLFGERYQQHLKMHNLLHVPFKLDYFGLPLHFFSVIRFESVNSRLKQLLLLSNNRLNKPKTILTKKHFRTINSIKDKIRDYNFDRGFPYNNHLISDPFYDLNERIASYLLDSSIMYSKIFFKEKDGTNIDNSILVEAKKLGFSKTIQSVISEKTFDSCIHIDEINKKTRFQFNCEDDSMIQRKQIIILIKTVLDLIYLSQDPTIPVDELKKEWIIHADLYFQCVYCLFGMCYQQHLKMHNLLHKISTINNCGWSYDFGDKSCLEMNISKNIAEEKEIEKIVDDINTSILLKSTDETLEESLNDPNDFTWLP